MLKTGVLVRPVHYCCTWYCNSLGCLTWHFFLVCVMLCPVTQTFKWLIPQQNGIQPCSEAQLSGAFYDCPTADNESWYKTPQYWRHDNFEVIMLFFEQKLNFCVLCHVVESL